MPNRCLKPTLFKDLLLQLGSGSTSIIRLDPILFFFFQNRLSKSECVSLVVGIMGDVAPSRRLTLAITKFHEPLDIITVLVKGEAQSGRCNALGAEYLHDPEFHWS